MADLGGSLDSRVLREGESGASQPNCEVAADGICKDNKENLSRNELPLLRLGAIKEEPVDEMVSEKAHIEPVGSDQETRDLSRFVEEHLGKVSLNGVVKAEKADSHDNNLVNLSAESFGLLETAGDNGISLKNETASDGDKSESNSDEESESESSSSFSSSSSSSESEDEEEDSKATVSGKKVKNKEAATEKTSDMEEGEIIMSDDADEMVAWSDDEEGNGNSLSGPIRSKNEAQVLPPVPAVNVALQPHHQTQPVGTILSMIGAQVIVEGVEKHDPLSDGSILWITETRLPLGIVDEIFGPVKNPYYIVRYNSECEVPADIQQGTPISYVPDFASHVLGDENLFKKGYDASNEHDEELGEDVEFSDDEKEAEYRKMLKMKKRGTRDSKPCPTRSERKQWKNQTKTWNQNQDREAKNLQDQEHSSSSSSGLGQNRLGNQPMFFQTRQGAQTLSSTALNGSWPVGITPPPPLPPQGLNLPSGLPANGMLWMQQNPTFPLYQTPRQTNLMFPQQMNSIPGLPLNFNPQLNCGPAIPPWSVGLDPNLVNLLQLQIGLQSQNAPMSLPMGGEQRVQTHGGQNSPNSQASIEISPPSFNQGRGGGGGGGRRGGGHHRGRGRGRGRARNHR